MTALYIEGDYIELSETIDYSINKTYEDLEDPTKIKNDFSKTIKIPITENNLNIFGKYTNSQYVSVANIKELSFDPNTKLNFKLYNDGCLIFEGYVKFTKCHYSTKDKYFECTLNSNVNGYFNKLSELKLGTLVDENLNLDSASNKNVADIIFNDKYKTKINRNYIVDCWDYYGEKYLFHNKEFTTPKHKIRNLVPLKTKDIVSFAMTNRGLYNNFNSKKIKCSSVNKTFDYDLYEGFLIKPIDVSGGKVYSEFRSYYQRPFVYVSALIDLFKQMADKIGVKLFLDPYFFNKNNPYYADLALLRPLLDNDEKTLKNTYEFSNENKNKNIRLGELNTYDRYIQKLSPYNKIELKGGSVDGNPVTGDLTVDGGDNYIYLVPDTYNVVNGTLTLDFKMNIALILSGLTGNTYIKRVEGRNIDLYIINDNDEKISNTISLVVGDYGWNSDIGTGYVNLNKYMYGDNASINLFNASKLIFKISQSTNTKYRLVIRPYSTEYPTKKQSDGPIMSDIPICVHKTKTDNPTSRTSVPCSISIFINQLDLKREFIFKNRTDSYITLDRILGSEFNISEFIINYCKLFNLKIVENDGYIKILTTNTYFKNAELLEVSDKIDRSVWTIEPNRFENNILSFDYLDSKSFIGDNYKNKYNINYGSKKLKTNYPFNNKTQDLYKKYNYIVESVKNYIFIEDSKQSTLSPFSELPSLYEIDGSDLKDVNDINALCFVKQQSFLKYYFNTDVGTADSGLNMFLVTDDSPAQISSGEYYWDDTLSEKAYSFLTVSNFIEKDGKKYSILFEKPNEIYSNQVDEEWLNDCNFVYDLFWKNYINDRYFGNDLTDNVAGNSEKLTTKMFLNLNDDRKLVFKDIYSIDGSHWLLNKIVDYNPSTNTSTNVEFVKLQNINNYKINLLPFNSNNYIYTPNTNFEFSYKEQYFEVNIYTDYDNYIIFENRNIITVLKEEKTDYGKRMVYKLDENTTSEDRVTYVYVVVPKGNGEEQIILSTITQHPKDDLSDVDFYATQYTALLNGANASNNTDDVKLYSNKYNKVVLSSVPSNLKVELPLIIGRRRSRYKQILVTSLKNINSTDYVIINYEDNGIILRSILFKVVTKRIRHIKKPTLTEITTVTNTIQKPVVGNIKVPNRISL